MGRRKKRSSRSRSAPAVNGRTITTIVGLLLFAAGVISLLALVFTMTGSPDGNGRLLLVVNNYITGYFGWVGIFLPFLFIIASGHFFSSPRLHLVKPSMTVGMAFILLALITYSGSGSLGQLIKVNLMMDFQAVGTYFIATVVLLIGCVLFFDTSLDVAFEMIRDKIAEMRQKSDESGKVKVKHKEADAEKGKRTFISDELPPWDLEQKTSLEPIVVLPKKDVEIKPVAVSNSSTWVYPPLTLLHDVKQAGADRGDVKWNADKIEETLDLFGIGAKVVEINKGPTVTQYALKINPGTKLSKITSLANDLALALAARTGAVRIEAPIPGRSLVGIEIPNVRSQVVTLKMMLESPVFDTNDPLVVPLGLDVTGQVVATSIAKMPHVLIAGTTGSGKSVMLNAWLATFLFRTRPDEVRLILVDPKRVELSLYNGIPHLIHEVIVEPQKILNSLRWTIAEMDARYKKFAEVGTRNIEGYNKLPDVEKIPYLIYVIDELADLMMVAPKDAEECITRIAQMARATGIHLVLATQRPSVDVITGLMKANIPTRLAFNVSSRVDSQVIIDSPGAEKLLGKGDMMYLPPDQAKPRRIQGPYVDEKEISSVVNFLKSQVPSVQYMNDVTSGAGLVAAGGRGGAQGGGSEETDPLLQNAIEIISSFDKASASLLQRRLSVGYSRAARILDQLEAAGYVGPAEGSKPREVIKRSGGI
ncbi:MAG: DNA translocase FtsK [Patescibacteria group bacterium]|nr:DNA translocase FtsK [Patescibacteria group bacterium]